MGYETGLYPCSPYYAVKVPVFSFEKLSNVDTQLGPEMKSTGEVLGIARTMEEALFKGLSCGGTGYTMKREGGVLISVRDTDKFEIPDIARKYAELGFELYATEGTARALAEAGIKSQVIGKIHESSFNAMTLLDSGKVQYVISTSAKGRLPNRDSVKIRRKAVERAIPCLTSLDTAVVLANSLRSRYSLISTELVDMAICAPKRRACPLPRCRAAATTISTSTALGRTSSALNRWRYSCPIAISAWRRWRSDHAAFARCGRQDAHVQFGRLRRYDVRQRDPLHGQVSIRVGHCA